MSDIEITESREDLISLQRKEKKELLAKTQQMKHSVLKGDKKKKKEVTAEITQMLIDLNLKHQEELHHYEIQHLAADSMHLKNSYTDSIVPNSGEYPVKRLELDEIPETSKSLHGIEVSPTVNICQKLSKAQKRRNKKAEQEKERNKAIAVQDKDNLTGLRHKEALEINNKLSERGLAIYEIPSDGNCLYKAVEHQLSTLNLQKYTVKSLRESTAKHLLLQKEEYLPFLTDPVTGDVLSEEQFFKYCDDIVNTSAWGGHVEIQILSSVCEKPIEIIQSDGPSIIVGDTNVDPRLILSYHRHAFGLGEHYNSVIPVGVYFKSGM